MVASEISMPAPRRRTVGMAVVAVLNVLLGGMQAVGNTIEVIQGRTFDGVTVTPVLGALGLAGAAFAALLAAGGVGTWQVRPYGRRLALIAAAGSVALLVVAAAVAGFAWWMVLAGSAYPVLLLVLYNLPRWRAAFAAR
ncbi:MAG TPA: hypothetical protein VHQ65_13100 [Thermoanaerobaculia bacterium]|nr:hypothetical protein [Thermoanaerobaculia bacterium]